MRWLVEEGAWPTVQGLAVIGKGNVDVVWLAIAHQIGQGDIKGRQADGVFWPSKVACQGGHVQLRAKQADIAPVNAQQQFNGHKGVMQVDGPAAYAPRGAFFNHADGAALSG